MDEIAQISGIGWRRRDPGWTTSGFRVVWSDRRVTKLEVSEQYDIIGALIKIELLEVRL